MGIKTFILRGILYFKMLYHKSHAIFRYLRSTAKDSRKVRCLHIMALLSKSAMLHINAFLIDVTVCLSIFDVTVCLLTIDVTVCCWHLKSLYVCWYLTSLFVCWYLTSLLKICIGRQVSYSQPASFFLFIPHYQHIVDTSFLFQERRVITSKNPQKPHTNKLTHTNTNKYTQKGSMSGWVHLKTYWCRISGNAYTIWQTLPETPKYFKTRRFYAHISRQIPSLCVPRHYNMH